MNEDDVNRLMLENANGKPLRDVLRQAFQLGAVRYGPGEPECTCRCGTIEHEE